MDAMQLLFLLLFALVIVLVFLALRRLVWWYWGINQHLENQRTIINLLSKQIELQQIIENQAARRRADTTAALQSHQPQSQARRPNPPQP